MAIGDTSFTIDDAGGDKIQVGDILEFGDASGNFTAAPSGHYYKITDISSSTVTIARFNPQTGVTETGGLRHAVVDNAQYKRYWEYYFQFSNAPSTSDDVSAAGGSNDAIGSYCCFNCFLKNWSILMIFTRCNFSKIFNYFVICTA